MDPSQDPADGAALRSTGPTHGDAFGMLLMECWEARAAPGRVLEFVERDDGYLTAGDAARYFAEPAAWSTLDHWACTQVRGRVLDIGSGAGRHTLYLQEAGYEVEALDVSPLAAEVCRRRGVRQIVVGSVAELVARGTAPFDSFLLLGNNLGLLADAQQARSVLATLTRMATPNAVIIGQGLDPYQTDNPLHHNYHRRNRMRGRMPGQIRMRVRHNNIATDWFDYLFMSITELQDLVANTAWRFECCETDGAQYVAVLRRTG